MAAAAAEMTVEEVQNASGTDTDKLSYEIFSILESKFLFGYTDPKLLCVPLDPPPPSPPHPPPPLSHQRGRVCILSLDGGATGVTGGVFAGKALSHLEQALKTSSGDPDARIADYFDLAAGTAAGGVIAGMLFSSSGNSGGRRRPLFSADDTWRFLLSRSHRLFPSKPHRPPFLKPRKRPLWKPTKEMESAMKEIFGEQLSLRQTLKPVLIPCYDLRSSAPLVFSRADAIESESYNFRLWEVARATWAEPGRVEPAEVRSIDGKTGCTAVDGGLVMSNPAAAAITHVLHNKQEFPFVRGVEDILVVSLGCGAGDPVGTGETGEDGYWRGVKRWGPKEWARPVARIAANGAADFVDHAVAMAFGQYRSANYVRIQAYCNAGLADVSALAQETEVMLRQKNVESVLFTGKRIGDKSNMEILDWVASELVSEHRTRSCRIAPTVVFKQVPTPNPS